MNNEVVLAQNCDIIKCSNCNKDLFFVHCVPVKENEKQLISTVQVSCPYCGDHSYDYTVKGQFRYHPAKDVRISGFKQEQGNDKVYFNTMRLT